MSAGDLFGLACFLVIVVGIPALAVRFYWNLPSKQATPVFEPPAPPPAVPEKDPMDDTPSTPHREPLAYFGDFLLEHQPEDREPWAIYPLPLIFAKDLGAFYCYTKEEAIGLIEKLQSLRK